MKRIKGVRKTTHKLLVKATQDYYLKGTNHNVIKYLEGDNINLSEEEKSDAWAIKTNLEDKIYIDNLLLL